MRQVVYISRAAPWIGDEAVSDIGQLSNKNNAARDVTGLLLFDGQRFIQALEGPDDAVGDTQGRIHADERHITVQIATDRAVDQRQFGAWNMECRRTPAGACSSAFLEKIKATMADVDNPALQAMFIGFAIMSRP